MIGLQGSRKEYSTRQEVQAASFLRPGPRNLHGVTSAVRFFGSKQSQSLFIFKRKGPRLPHFDERSVKEFVATCSPPQKLTEREMYDYEINGISSRNIQRTPANQETDSSSNKNKKWTKTVHRKFTEVGTNKARACKEMLKIVGSAMQIKATMSFQFTIDFLNMALAIFGAG